MEHSTASSEKKMGSLDTWIYTSEKFALPGAPVGMPTWDFPCEVCVRPGLSFVMSASYNKPRYEQLGVWQYEEGPHSGMCQDKLSSELPFVVYAWRADRRRAAPLSEAYIEENNILKETKSDEDDPVYKDSVRPLTGMEAEFFDVPSYKRWRLILASSRSQPSNK